MAKKGLDIPWDTTIPRGQHLFKDHARTLGGPVATTKISDDSARLADKDRTLLGSLGRAPKPPKRPPEVPFDDTQRAFKA